MSDFREFFLKNKKLHHDHNQEFLQIFHVSISSYWDIMTGFDVVKFDDYIKPIEGVESTADAIKRQYGDRALELVSLLIGYEEPKEEEEDA